LVRVISVAKRWDCVSERGLILGFPSFLQAAVRLRVLRLPAGAVLDFSVDRIVVCGTIRERTVESSVRVRPVPASGWHAWTKQTEYPHIESFTSQDDGQLPAGQR
jgi:hypothetical protein